MTPPVDQAFSKGQPGIVRAALFGSCPRCGARGLWAAPARFSDHCRVCGCAFAGAELTGRSAYLVILPVTVMLMLAASRLDEVVRLPFWVLALLWPPLVAVVVIGALRLAKAAVLVARLRRAG